MCKNKNHENENEKHGKNKKKREKQEKLVLSKNNKEKEKEKEEEKKEEVILIVDGFEKNLRMHTTTIDTHLENGEGIAVIGVKSLPSIRDRQMPPEMRSIQSMSPTQSSVNNININNSPNSGASSPTLTNIALTQSKISVINSSSNNKSAENGNAYGRPSVAAEGGGVGVSNIGMFELPDQATAPSQAYASNSGIMHMASNDDVLAAATFNNASTISNMHMNGNVNANLTLRELEGVETNNPERIAKSIDSMNMASASDDEIQIFGTVNGEGK